MWILPKQMMERFESVDGAERIAEICETDLLHRGKPAKAKTWAKRLKKYPFDMLVERASRGRRINKDG